MQDEQPGEREQIERKKAKAKSKQLLSEKEALVDAERQYRRRSMHVYPNSLGVTGEAF